MPDCPLADQCPSFSERIEGMGCMHYGDRGGAEWCQHYNQPIRDLKQQPVTPGEEVVVEVTDIHESGAGVGRTEDGFIVMVDGLLPEARAKVRIVRVHSNHATGEEVERLPLEPEGDEEEAEDAEGESDAGAEVDADGDDESEDDEADAAVEGDDEEEARERPRRARRERLGSRDNFWGN
jgi:predicted RNA-binding protein with TRAM domain